MSLFDFAGKLADAKLAIDLAEGTRREKVRASLALAVRQAYDEDVSSEEIITRHLPAILAASSQAHTVREIAKMLGVGDLLRGLIDRMESGK